jgi:hypothetical protein
LRGLLLLLPAQEFQEQSRLWDSLSDGLTHCPVCAAVDLTVACFATSRRIGAADR